MFSFIRLLLFLGALGVSLLAGVHQVAAHAALSRSDPPAGAVLPDPPAEIRIWFTEPLEPRFTSAQVLTVAGEPVPGTQSAVAPDDDHQLIVTLPADLPAGGYTVAWRNVSAADGHSLDGYFGFSVGSAATGASTAAGTASATGQPAQALTRGLALVGLAMLLAIAPVTLGVLMPAGRTVAGLPERPWLLRRYAVVAAAFALLASVAALAAQAATIAPDLALPAAIGETLTGTRYGQLWIARIVLLGLCAAALLAALWGQIPPSGWGRAVGGGKTPPPGWGHALPSGRGESVGSTAVGGGSSARRRGFLIVSSLLAIAAPLPFSLLSHAAAQTAGERAAIAADALHLLAAAIWGGGLFLLAVVLVPALRPLPAGAWRDVLRVAIPRFSALALAAWGILVLSGLYSVWLQVGTVEALRTTPYGQTLLVKGALLIPVLALAAVHFVFGKRDASSGSERRLRLTIAAEALLVVVVLLVVGRLIGLEPARAVVAERTPTQLLVPLRFDTKEGPRDATLAISPGATGVNSFTLDVSGAPLPSGAEGVLRFALPARDIGAQELRLPEAGPNRYAASGSELSLAGDWQIEAIVRKIGAFSWSTNVVVPVAATPPLPPESNPPPRFGPGGVLGELLLALGMIGLAAAVALRHLPLARRSGAAVAGVVVFAMGGAVLAGARLPPASSAPILAQPVPVTASPSASPAHAHEQMMTERHATPVVPLPGVGTPVSQDGLMVTVAAEPASTAPTTVTVQVVDSQGAPVSKARVVIFAEMTGMGEKSEGTPATEISPGRYQAENLMLTMGGPWQLTVRVSPHGEATRVFRFAVDVP